MLYRNFVSVSCVCIFVFFFKQKTAYEMRISDWSSDVCSSDLKEIRIQSTDRRERQEFAVPEHGAPDVADGDVVIAEAIAGREYGLRQAKIRERLDRKSVV